MALTLRLLKPFATSTMIYTTADAVAARLRGDFLTTEQQQIPMMEKHGFVIEYRQDNIMFRRGNLHVWRVLHNGHLMWQTARLKNGYYQEHIPVNSLEHIVETFKR